ncbi:RNA polymerase sigma factor [Parachryseolinea silvisoli]|uniref:RNA polymerase sigma factor n=1 Tax=Parachryseolinea silvisoli TaxID=2873601 RepID=UPI002265EF15|nr:sigma-70 family RNA polymerase sigma factor [Parachryseolinea silvisoli]MCD9014441.1 sigma-70 family RNA polymerase sigma factor [Parachryseolinea silvisoli]
MINGTEEKAMLTSLAKGSRLAFKQVFDLYYTSVFTYARKYLHSTEEAEEATQDVFIRIWTKRAYLADVDNFSTYLFSVKKNIMARRLKNLVLNTYLGEDNVIELLSDRSADDEIRTTQATAAYDHALQTLPPYQLRVYTMVKEQEMTYEQVGNELNISTNTVKFHMKEAFRFLRQRLKPFTPLVALLAPNFVSILRSFTR